MSKQLLSRYVWLVDTIYQAGSAGITFHDLAEKWKDDELLSKGAEYNWRTFMRHRNDVWELFGVEIDCHKSTNSYYIVERGSLTDTSAFRRWLLETLTVNNHINESAQLKDRILLEPNPSGGEFLSTILEAMRDNLMLTFDYQSFWYENGHVSHFFNVEPYALKVFRRRWYLLGKYGDNPLRVYALDRMLDIDIEFEDFTLPADFDAEDFFNSCFGIIVGDEEPQLIQLKVDAFQANYLHSLPLHHSQKVVEQTKEYTIFSYFLRITYDLRQELLALGDTTEVLYPKALRKEMATICKKMAQRNK